MSNTHVRLEIWERVAHLTLARPEQGNALTVEMAEELGDAAARVADEPGVGAVLLSGAGTSFCQLEHETRQIVEAGRSIDASEGIQAFVEKRAPRFRGE